MIANPGSNKAAGIALTSPNGALSTGEYTTKSLLGDSEAASFRVSKTGAIHDWIPVPAIDGLAVHIVEVSKDN